MTHLPHGFYSLIGGKFTTAPLMSEDAATAIWPQLSAEHDMAATLVKHHG
jgi:glycerol-3-phosphate dehydrogenase